MPWPKATPNGPLKVSVGLSGLRGQESASRWCHDSYVSHAHTQLTVTELCHLKISAVQAATFVYNLVCNAGRGIGALAARISDAFHLGSSDARPHIASCRRQTARSLHVHFITSRTEEPTDVVGVKSDHNLQSSRSTGFSTRYLRHNNQIEFNSAGLAWHASAAKSTVQDWSSLHSAHTPDMHMGISHNNGANFNLYLHNNSKNSVRSQLVVLLDQQPCTICRICTHPPWHPLTRCAILMQFGAAINAIKVHQVP